MPIVTNAAVLRGYDSSFEIEPIKVSEPGPGQVVVRLMASGICHSDESARIGAFPHPLPVVLGHEGAGIIHAVGPQVTDVEVGDRVVCVGSPGCGDCYTCDRGQEAICERRPELQSGVGFKDQNGNELLAFGGLGTFSEFITVHRRAIVPVQSSLPFEQLALLGCAIITGVGAVVNATDIGPGSTVGVVGCGGVGQSIIQGAKVAGASKIIALDLDSYKRQTALDFGATDAIDPSAEEAVEKVAALTNGRGVDYAFEAVGHGATILQAFRIARAGGTVVAVGVAGKGEFSVSPNELILSARTLIGSMYGSGSASKDIPLLASMGENGQLKLAEMVTRVYPLSQINEAFEAMNSNKVIRSVITYQ